MRRIWALLLLTAMVATIAPAAATDAEPGLTPAPPGAPTDLEAGGNAQVFWTKGTGTVDAHRIEWQDTRVPTDWLDEVAAPGALAPLVVNGDDVGIDRHRYGVFMVGIDDDDIVTQCGGVLIDPEWVLTAAHCTEYQPTNTFFTRPEYFSFVYGLDDWTELNLDNRTTNLQFGDQVFVHPDYDRDFLRNDIALIKLDAPFDPAEGDVIPLYEFAGPADGDPAYLTGWGATINNGFTSDDLQGLEVAVDESCGTWPADNPSTWDDDTVICASGLPGGACNGDSGGPLVVNEGGQIMLIGLVSFGSIEGCAESTDKPDVYTRVANYIDWIEARTGALKSEMTVSGDATSATLTGLRPGRTYVVTVTAVNESGSSGDATFYTEPGQFLFTAEEIGVDCDQFQSHPLIDIAITSFAYSSVGCIFNLGVTTGTSPTAYSPANPVTRAQMAAFIERLYERLTGEDCGGAHPFTDVPASSFAFFSVGCIFNLGITTGTSPTTYSPDATVTREQMAAFIARLYRILTGEECGAIPPFVDVSPFSFAFFDIGCIAELGVTTGTSPTTYSPTATVTRDQMAAFIARLYRLVSA